MTCTHYLGTLPCDNPNPHEGGPHGRGCTHDAGDVPDHHDRRENQ